MPLIFNYVNNTLNLKYGILYVFRLQFQSHFYMLDQKMTAVYDARAAAQQSSKHQENGKLSLKYTFCCMRSLKFQIFLIQCMKNILH